MQVENHKEEVPFAHYEELFRSMNPAEAAERTGESWDGKAFCVTLLGTRYRITHPECAVQAENGTMPPPAQRRRWV